MSERFQKQELDSNDHKGVRKGAKGVKLVVILGSFGVAAKKFGPKLIKTIFKAK